MGARIAYSHILRGTFDRRNVPAVGDKRNRGATPDLKTYRYVWERSIMAVCCAFSPPSALPAISASHCPGTINSEDCFHMTGARSVTTAIAGRGCWQTHTAIRDTLCPRVSTLQQCKRWPEWAFGIASGVEYLTVLYGWATIAWAGSVPWAARRGAAAGRTGEYLHSWIPMMVVVFVSKSPSVVAVASRLKFVDKRCSQAASLRVTFEMFRGCLRRVMSHHGQMPPLPRWPPRAFAIVAVLTAVENGR
ncbi:hypothetical protein G7046_g7546 [Stylonectria norvegica]|nr:hypothetical protein G7046_g7546 [Stylonectria norvegica]